MTSKDRGPKQELQRNVALTGVAVLAAMAAAKVLGAYEYLDIEDYAFPAGFFISAVATWYWHYRSKI